MAALVQYRVADADGGAVSSGSANLDNQVVVSRMRIKLRGVWLFRCVFILAIIFAFHQALTNIFEVASDKCQHDHPLCTDCSEAIFLEVRASSRIDL